MFLSDFSKKKNGAFVIRFGHVISQELSDQVLQDNDEKGFKQNTHKKREKSERR